jgi:M6 family metalloprotease-like protein
MRLWFVIICVLLIFNISFATVPPLKEGPLPPLVKEHTEKMQLEYPKGNLAKILQQWAKRGPDGSRISSMGYVFPDTLSQVFPVLVGKYADATDVQVDAPEQLQQELFDGPWPTRTMREFYLENSYGQYELGGTVYGWIQASQNESAYTGPPGTYGMGGYAANFVRELLDSVDAEVDFGDFDNDGDGYVETLIVVHSGPGQEYYGDSPTINHIWSHSSRLSNSGDPYLTNDRNVYNYPVRINNYIIQPAINRDGSLISIGVFCHEFGHALGLPDLYDTDYSSGGIGDWGIMSGGSWNTASSPSHFTAWSKEILGWLTPVVIEEDTDLETILPIENSQVAYKLWYEGGIAPYTSSFGATLNVGREYFIIENRQRIGSDQHLYGTGLMIWHVDNTRMSNTNDSHRLVDLEEADGLDQIDNSIQNSGDDGDPYPGSTLNDLFNYYSYPSSQAYDGSDSKVEISNITEDLTNIIANLRVGMIKYEITQIVMNDDNGNGNGIFEPGEQISLWVEIKNNTATTASNVNVEISCESTDISIQNSSVNFGNISSDDSLDNSGNPFLIDISSQSTEYTAQLQLLLSTDGDYSITKPIDLVIGIPEMLVVDRDISSLAFSHFRTWLDSNRYAYEIIDDENYLDSKYRYNWRDVIVVFGGEDSQALSDTVLQDSLVNWMDGYKSLLVIAPYVASELDTSAFAREFLHINYVNTTTSIMLRGSAGDPLGFGGNFVFIEDGEREMVEAYNGGVVALPFYNTGYGGIVRYEDGFNNKIVFSTVDFRDVKDTSPVSEAVILIDIFNWLGAITDITSYENENLISDYVLLQNYPNPFNPNTSIRFYVPAQESDLQLIIFNSLGENIKTFNINNADLGWNEINWNGKSNNGASVASGIYYYMLNVGDTKLVRKMILLK